MFIPKIYIFNPKESINIEKSRSTKKGHFFQHKPIRVTFTIDRHTPLLHPNSFYTSINKGFQ